ncbi:NAD(P)/FAD-dependent oxidoreductase [Salibacterium sp. K-3]
MVRTEVAVIGGGPAGRSAALVLGRALRDVILMDDGKPRDMVTAVSHGFLTRDGEAPEMIRQKAAEELSGYSSVQQWTTRVSHLAAAGEGFRLETTDHRQIECRRVIAATGKKETLPAVQGMENVFGKSVFVCPYCDGWERRNEPLAVFGSGEGIVRYASLIQNWSTDIMVFTNGTPLSSEQKQELLDHDVEVMEAPISECVSQSGRLEYVRVENGDVFWRTGGFVMGTGRKQAFDFPPSLGVHRNEKNEYETDRHGQTSVKGLYVIGDAGHSFTGLVCAAAQGYETAVHLHQNLLDEEWRQ